MEVNNSRVLIIDDNDIDIKIVTKIIEINFKSISVSAYTSCQSAINYLESTPKEAHPNIILLDLNMPDMNGAEFIDYVDKHGLLGEECAFYLMSSSINSKEILKTIDNPRIKKFLSKPINKNLFDILGN